MLNDQEISAITVLNQGITRKCKQCIRTNNSELEDDDSEDLILDCINNCPKRECGLHSIRYQG